MLSRVYRIPKGRFCVGTVPCSFLVFGLCSHTKVELKCEWTKPPKPTNLLPVKTAQCELDFPYGGIVTVDAEGPSRADAPDMSDDNLDRGLRK